MKKIRATGRKKGGWFTALERMRTGCPDQKHPIAQNKSFASMLAIAPWGSLQMAKPGIKVLAVDLISEGNLKGLFKGFDGPGTLFEFSDGSRWRQVGADVSVNRLLMPNARILRVAGGFHIEIEGILKTVEVAALYW